MKVWYLVFTFIYFNVASAQEAIIEVKQDTLKIVQDFTSGGAYAIDIDKNILALTTAKANKSCKVNRPIYIPTSTTTSSNQPKSTYDICKKRAKISGYKIQIYYSKDRAAANKVRSSFQKQFPGIFPELVYWQPDYRVLVGDYFSRKSAGSDLAKIKKKYPASLLVQHRIYCRRAK